MSNSEPLINMETGIKYCAGSKDFYLEMLQLFCDGYEEHLANISRTYETEDWKTYTVYVHALKSSSLNIGGEQLSSAAKELEFAGKKILESDNGDEGKEYIINNNEKVMKLYNDTILEAGKILSTNQ